GAGPGGRPESLPRRRADRGPADPVLGARGQVGAAPAGDRPLRRLDPGRPPGNRRRSLRLPGVAGAPGPDAALPPGPGVRPGEEGRCRPVVGRVAKGATRDLRVLTAARGRGGRPTSEGPSRPPREAVGSAGHADRG